MGQLIYVKQNIWYRNIVLSSFIIIFYPLNRVLQVSLIRLSKISLYFPESMNNLYHASKIWEFKVPPGSIMPNKFRFLVFIMRMELFQKYHVHKVQLIVGFSDSILLFEVFLSRNIDVTNTLTVCQAKRNKLGISPFFSILWWCIFGKGGAVVASLYGSYFYIRMKKQLEAAGQFLSVGLKRFWK